MGLCVCLDSCSDRSGIDNMPIDSATQIVDTVLDVFYKVFDIEMIQGLLMISITAGIIILVIGIVKIGK